MADFSKYFEEKPVTRKRKIVKRIIWILVVIILILFIGSRVKQWQAKKIEAQKKIELAQKKSAVPVEVEKIVRENYIEKIETNGDIEGIKRVNLYSDYPGKLLEIYVKEGQYVNKNQVLAVMNRDILVDRFENTPIKTLISGIVGKIYLKEGETITPQTPVFTVVDVSSVKCLTKIVEKNLAKIKIGNPAFIRVDAYPNVVFEGVVSEISPVLDPLSRAAEVTILINNTRYPQTPLRPGMYAQVEIQYGVIPNVLLVPYSAVLEGDGGTKYIFVYRDNVARKVVVKTGGIKHYGNDTTKDRIVVYGDIKEGEFVIYVGHQFLMDQEKIRFTYGNETYGPEGKEKGKE